MSLASTRGPNVKLAWALEVVGWSPERLARAVSRELAGLGHTRVVSRNSPAQWRDAGMVPRAPIPGIVAHVLARALDQPLSVHELWQGRAHDPQLVVPADFGLDTPWTPAGTVEALHTVRSDRMMRRQFLAVSGMSVFGPALDWARTALEPLGPSTQGTRVSPELADALDASVATLRRLDDAGAGELVLRRAEDEFCFITDLLRTARYDGRMATRLHRTLASLIQLAGWVCDDLGLEAKAQRYYLTGLRAAHTGDDPQLGARILGCLATQAMRLRRPSEALLLLDAAQRGVKGRATPTVEATLAFNEAHAHALAGDELECALALNRAEKLLDRSHAEDDPEWTYWVTADPARCMTITIGACMADLGPEQLGRAEHHLQDGISRYSDSYARDKAIDLPILADVQRRRRDLDAACATAMEALRLSLATGTRQGCDALRSFRKQIAADADTPAVDDFLAQTRDTVGV